ncbi:MAG: cytochrome c [Polyangiales bacterium]
MHSVRGKAWLFSAALCCSFGCDGDASDSPPKRMPPRESLPPAAGSCAGPFGATPPTRKPSSGSAARGPEPERAPVVSLDKVPPISGGTLLATRDGSLLVAADPDRDRLYFVDPASMQLRFTRELEPGDEPGRVVEDAEGHVHIALRGSGAVVSIGREPAAAITRRKVCDLPRGLAYDAARDVLHVACAEGELVTLPVAETASVTRRLRLGGDLRDVVEHEGQLFVSRFRSAELLALAADGAVEVSASAPTFRRTKPRTIVHPDCTQTTLTTEVDDSATGAWRMLDVPGHGVTLLHQRARLGEVALAAGGYGDGGPGCASSVVASAVTVAMQGATPRSADIRAAVLAVDIASDPTGARLAVAAPGNWHAPASQVLLLDLDKTAEWVAPTLNGPDVSEQMGACAASYSTAAQIEGQATAVAFVSARVLAVQQREPAGISFVDPDSGQRLGHLDLKQASRLDTGHTLFHAGTGAALACASCHLEGGDDSHVWTFQDIGPRRTQQLRGGILGTEPFHWNGDMSDFAMLVDEVLVNRMSGTRPTPDEAMALARYIDRLPALKLTAADESAVARGKLLFEAEAVGCATCHAGAALTNSQSVDVGTGAVLQVPSLHNVALRTPLMHDGCAHGLMDRFTDPRCGGGEAHGHTAQLDAAQLADLVAYLETL